MKRTVPVSLLLLACAFLCGCAAGPRNPEAEQAAMKAAESWLELIDNGRYEESYDEAARFFRLNLEQDKWVESMNGIRALFGKTVSRQVKRTAYRTSLPGVPDGQYVIIQYNTRFENKKSAVETITPMRETNGAWRVSGYFVK